MTVCKVTFGSHVVHAAFGGLQGSHSDLSGTRIDWEQKSKVDQH